MPQHTPPPLKRRHAGACVCASVLLPLLPAAPALTLPLAHTPTFHPPHRRDLPLPSSRTRRPQPAALSPPLFLLPLPPPIPPFPITMAFVGAAAAFRASAPARPATSAFTGTRVSAAVSRRTTGPVMSLDPVVASISNSLVTLGAADGVRCGLPATLSCVPYLSLCRGVCRR